MRTSDPDLRPRPLQEKDEPVAIQFLTNMLATGYTILNPDGEDVTDLLIEDVSGIVYPHCKRKHPDFNIVCMRVMHVEGPHCNGINYIDNKESFLPHAIVWRDQDGLT